MKKGKVKNKNNVLCVDKVHFIIYLITLIIGLLSSIGIILLGWHFENVLINYFLSLTASLIITSIFAYLLDVANSKSHEVELATKRTLLFNPLKNEIAAMMGRTSIIWNYEDLQDKEINYANIESCVDSLLNKYIICIDKLSKQGRDIKLINESFNIKQWEEYGIREIEKQIKIILDNQITLISENILMQEDCIYLNLLYKSISNAKLPYLSIVYDKNISKATVEWPQSSLSDIDINNLHSSFKYFISILKSVIANISEFNSLEKFSIKPTISNHN